VQDKMFKFTLNISGVDYTEYLSYPFILNEKSLDDSESIYEMQLTHTPFAEPIRPNQRAYITVEEDGVIKKSYFLLTLADKTQKIGRAEKYNHSITLIEYINFLDQQILPDITVTRIQGVYEPTLKDVVERILEVVNIDISLSSATATILDAVQSPE
jgi:hypothetical protein